MHHPVKLIALSLLITSSLASGITQAQSQYGYLDHLLFDGADVELLQMDLKAQSMGNLGFIRHHTQRDLFLNPSRFYTGTKTQLFVTPALKLAIIEGTEVWNPGGSFFSSLGRSLVNRDYLNYELPLGGIYRSNNFYLAGVFSISGSSLDENARIEYSEPGVTNQINYRFIDTRSYEYLGSLGYRLSDRFMIGLSARNYRKNISQDMLNQYNCDGCIPFDLFEFSNDFDQQIFSLGLTDRRTSIRNDYQIQYAVKDFQVNEHSVGHTGLESYSFNFNRRRALYESDLYTSFNIEWKTYSSEGYRPVFLSWDNVNIFEEMNSLALSLGVGLERNFGQLIWASEFEFAPRYTHMDKDQYRDLQYSEHEYSLRSGIETSIGYLFRIRLGVELNTLKVYERSDEQLDLIEFRDAIKETILKHQIQPVFTGGLEREFNKFTLTYFIRYGTQNRNYQVPDDASRIFNEPLYTRLSISYPF